MQLNTSHLPSVSFVNHTPSLQQFALRSQARASNSRVITKACLPPCKTEALPPLPDVQVPAISRSLVNGQRPILPRDACLSAPEIVRLTDSAKQFGEAGVRDTWRSLQGQRERKLDPRIDRNLNLAVGAAVLGALAVATPVASGLMFDGGNPVYFASAVGVIGGTGAFVVTAAAAEILRRFTSI